MSVGGRSGVIAGHALLVGVALFSLRIVAFALSVAIDHTSLPEIENTFATYKGCHDGFMNVRE